MGKRLLPPLIGWSQKRKSVLRGELIRAGTASSTTTRPRKSCDCVRSEPRCDWLPAPSERPEEVKKRMAV